ncbi:5-oxoprolinase (ATP-hydrolyzing) [Fibrisoma limi BUZ 3]|uniref:5-oxoprolinase (ATP-hydrolyzing) n=1 Tax=Fibrisoma limi BUZ 3 TaxID=1185876 RepID=I2GIZ6_9BACT|nr:hydantoinase B/oxoprolinase family protein [Fibrisoma limi]CCH53871.1 5-oxoprolinase (ATP-hydrolyzing) [Fibrisoma limi BUZ 3]
MWQIWIDTGGTFTDGLALDPTGILHRTKVLSSSQLRGRLVAGSILTTSGQTFRQTESHNEPRPVSDGLTERLTDSPDDMLTQSLRLEAPWIKAPIFDGYRLRVVETGDEFTVHSLTTDGLLQLADTASGQRSDASVRLHAEKTDLPLTVELFTGEEAPVLAARLLTQTPLGQPFPPLEMRLGTTKGTNALLERKGGRVALLVTKGFRDLLTIGTQQRPNLFQLAIPPAEVLYENVLEVDERLTADGQPLTPISADTIRQLIEQLQQQRPDAVAISLLNAYRNPTHEHQLRDALTAAGFDTITLSTDVSTAPQYVSRTQTAVVDAYLTPVLKTYLTNIQAQLSGNPSIWDHPVPDHPVRVMTSAGGLVKAELFRPKDSLLSGPAGGIIGSASVWAKLPLRNSQQRVPRQNEVQMGVLTLDMGGTSTDVARIQNGLDYRFSTKIGQFDLQLPSLAIETVAAGGGSICWFDGQLRVGPHSAGATPGPACYGAGAPGQPLLLTITDVNLLLGKLHPAQFGIPVFPDKAEAALQQILDQIGDTDRLTVLRGFERIADEAMAGAIRKISVQRGFDPRDYALLVFGGAGGLHGCSVARLLGIEQLVLPFDGGLLSAYGMGQARIERMASRSVLLPLTEVEPILPDLILALATQAKDELTADVGTDQPIDVQSVVLYMRLKGQETSLPVPLAGHLNGPLTERFQSHYQHLYGHYPEGRSIEVESIRVLASTQTEQTAISQPPTLHRHVVPAFQAGPYPAYDWTELQEGDTFRGPALLLNRTSSAFIEAGWRLIVQADQNAVVDYIADVDEPTEPELNDVAQTELFARRFMAIAEEMGAQLQRTAFSTNVKERLDFSCALLDQNAQLVANAPHIPVHLGSLGVCARLVLEKLSIGPGDVVITNHPKYGGSHLPDVTLLSGVFSDEDELVGYVINRAHHAEIGGRVPGSMPPDATNLAEEGVVLEPQYVVKNGVFRWDGPDGLATRFTDGPYPTRALAENRADIEAALASLRAGEQALKQLVRQHGSPAVQHYMQQLKQSAAQAIHQRLTGGLTRYVPQQAINIPPEDQTDNDHQTSGQTMVTLVQAEEALDDGHRIVVQLTLDQQTLTVDFTGTSPVHPNNLNANVSVLHSAVLYVLRLWIEADSADPSASGSIPLNEGLMEPVRLILPESSFLNPVFSEDGHTCPAVVGGNTEVSQRLVDTLLKALGLAACSQGTMNNFLFGTDAFGYYETIGGGAGATVGADGRSAVHQHMTNTKLTDPEELERRYPVRLHQFSIREGSGGAGRWRGGDGIIREIEFLEPVQATLLSQHRIVAPYGLNGGDSGKPGRQTLLHADGTVDDLPGIFSRAMQTGDRIRIETPGGGGVG